MAARFGLLIVLRGQHSVDQPGDRVVAGKMPTTSARRPVSFLSRPLYPALAGGQAGVECLRWSPLESGNVVDECADDVGVLFTNGCRRQAA